MHPTRQYRTRVCLSSLRPLAGRNPPPAQPKPSFCGSEHASAFQEVSVAGAYRYRPPYPAATFDILSQLAVDRPRHVLDAGCGTGEIARRLVDRVDRVDAVDIAQAMINLGRQLPRVPAVRHQINLLEPRALIAPGRVGLDGNLLFEQAPRFRCSQTPRLRPLFGSRKPAVDGGWTHAQERRSLLLREPQCPLSFQRGNQIREPWRQALPADPAGGLGRDLQGADDLSGVGWPPPCTGQPGSLR